MPLGGFVRLLRDGAPLWAGAGFFRWASVEAADALGQVVLAFQQVAVELAIVEVPSVNVGREVFAGGGSRVSLEAALDRQYSGRKGR